MTALCAVGLDFDHTLGLDNGLEITAYYRLAAELGHSISERDTAWRAFTDTLLARFRAAAMELDAAVDTFVERLGLTPQAHYAQRYRDICYGLVDNLVTPIDGASELLGALAERSIPTAILTNGWNPLQRLKIARTLAYSGPVLVSGDLGTLKPDAAAFGKLIGVLGVPREAVWYVGDNPKTDVAGSQGAGLRGVWFDWEHLPYPADAPRPDARIGRLSELLDLLPGPDVRAENVGK
jgi:FMN phosphatase YigB (HAD superfamily)